MVYMGCLRNAHGTYIECSRNAHGMYMECSRNVHGICTWNLHGMYMEYHENGATSIFMKAEVRMAFLEDCWTGDWICGHPGKAQQLP